MPLPRTTVDAIDEWLAERVQPGERRRALKGRRADPVIEIKEHYFSDGRKERQLGNGYDQLRIKPDFQAGQPCHAAVVDSFSALE